MIAWPRCWGWWLGSGPTTRCWQDDASKYLIFSMEFRYGLGKFIELSSWPVDRCSVVVQDVVFHGFDFLLVLGLLSFDVKLEADSAVLQWEAIPDVVFLLELDQGAEFRLHILDIELVVLIAHLGVHSRYRDVIDSHLALVAPSDLQGHALIGEDHMQVALFLVVLLGVHSF